MGSYVFASMTRIRRNAYLDPYCELLHPISFELLDFAKKKSFTNVTLGASLSFQMSKPTYVQAFLLALLGPKIEKLAFNFVFIRAPKSAQLHQNINFFFVSFLLISKNINEGKSQLEI